MMKRRDIFKAIGALLFGGLVAEAETAKDIADSIESLKEPKGISLKYMWSTSGNTNNTYDFMCANIDTCEGCPGCSQTWLEGEPDLYTFEDGEPV